MCVLCHLRSFTCFLFAQEEVTGSLGFPRVSVHRAVSVLFLSFSFFYTPLALSLITRPEWIPEERTRHRAFVKLVKSDSWRGKKVAVMRSNLWNSSSWKFRFCCFSPLLFLGLKTWSLAPVFMVRSFCNYHWYCCYCSMCVIFGKRGFFLCACLQKFTSF